MNLSSSSKKLNPPSRSRSSNKNEIKKSATISNTSNKTKIGGKKTDSKIKTNKKKSEKSKEKTVKKSKTMKDKSKEKIPGEIKITKNVDTINRLINNSHDILSHQNSLLEKCEEISKKITSADFEIERQVHKNENDEFSLFFEKYSHNLTDMMGRLKLHSEEVENIKCNYI
jgi:hypothetical protein